MMNKVIAVIPQKNFQLFVTLADGRSGLFDVSPYLDKGIFRELQDDMYFSRVRLAFGGVAWEHGQDFSGDTIALEIKEMSLALIKQQTEFSHLLQKLENTSSADVEIALAEREVVEPESELTPEIIALVQSRIQNKKAKSKMS